MAVDDPMPQTTRRKVTFGDVRDYLQREAARIEGTQRALVAAGYLAVPDAAKMRDAEIADAGWKLLEMIGEHSGEVLRLLGRLKYGRRG